MKKLIVDHAELFQKIFSFLQPADTKAFNSLKAYMVFQVLLVH